MHGEGWYHATVNIGDTHSIAQRSQDYSDGSPSGDSKQAQSLMRRNKKAGERYPLAFWDLAC